MSRFEILLKGAIRLRWFILAAMAIYLSLFEAEEHGVKGLQILLIKEIYVYFLTLLLAGLSLELLAKSHRKLESALKILDQKHRLTSNLALENDWQNLVNRLAQVPRMIEGIEESTLFLYDQTNDRFDPVSNWNKNETGNNKTLSSENYVTCFEENSGKFHPLRNDDCPNQKTLSGSNEFCLHIPYGRVVIAMLRMRMTPGLTPDPDQVEMIDHLVNEIATGLVTGLERKNLADLRVAEAARAERHNMSRYLHDHVSQNLGYVRLKLDQFSSSMPPPPLADLKKDFAQMSDAVNETYEIVRGSLENMRLPAKPQLLKLIQEHTDKVGQRAQLEICVSQSGEAQDLPLDKTRKILYIVREALSNIEKHAGAGKAEIELAWRRDELAVTISDDGKGFNLAEVDAGKHFGLEIMHESVAELHGHFEIRPSKDMGTLVIFRVPINLGESN